ncbi:CHAT domain-containing protein [Desulfonema ishimotonii]|nr:CHAT domain-containing protein [Desulfonema ishimotonii]
MRPDYRNDDTIWLDISRNGNALRLGLRRAEGDAIWHYEPVSFPLEETERKCRAMQEAFSAASRKGGNGSWDTERLRANGQALCDTLLTPGVKEALSHTDAEYLILTLDDQVINFPWELLCTGKGFLCEQFRIGRRVATCQPTTESVPRDLSPPLKMWIVADDGASSGAELGNVYSEGREILSIIDMLNQDEDSPIIEADFESECTSEEIFSRIRGFDLFHFAGHADFVPEDPGQSGWRVDRGHIRAADIHNMAGGAPMPAMVFSNACQSACNQFRIWGGSGDDGPFGLANAFMLAGVQHYIGSVWDIMDEAGSRFAQNFYRFLTAGTSVGEAVRRARQEMIRPDGDICWASYVLYGDPRTVYFESDKNAESRPEATDRIPVPQPADPTDPDEPRSEAVTVDGADFSSPSEEKTAEKVSKPTPSSGKGMPHFFVPLLIVLLAGVMALFVLLLSRHPPSHTQTDEWTSQPLNVAVVPEKSPDSVSPPGKTESIATAMESSLQECRRVKVVARGSVLYDHIIKEWDLWKKYIAEQERPQVRMLPATLILSFNLLPDNTVTMHLSDTRQTDVRGIFEYHLADGTSPLMQKKEMGRKIVAAIRAEWPVQGIITKVAGEEIHLNIGSDVGVGLGSRFKIVERMTADGPVFREETEFEVFSLSAKNCIVKTAKGEKSGAKKGMKVAGL